MSFDGDCDDFGEYYPDENDERPLREYSDESSESLSSIPDYPIDYDEPIIYSPGRLQTLSAISICKSVHRAHEILLLPIPWAIKYILLTEFTNMEVKRKHNIRKKYLMIFTRKLGYLTRVLRNHVNKKSTFNISKYDLKPQKQFLSNVSVKYLVEYWKVMIYENLADKEKTEEKTYPYSLQMCNKCIGDFTVYLEQCDKTENFKIIDKESILQHGSFLTFLWFISESFDRLCEFCHKTILIIPLEFEFEETYYCKQRVMKDEKVLRGIDIPFNWMP